MKSASTEFSHVYEVEYRGNSNTPVILRNNQELTLEQIPIMERFEVMQILTDELTRMAVYAGDLCNNGIMALTFDKEPSAP